MWTWFMPAAIDVKRRIDGGEIGDLLVVEADFGIVKTEEDGRHRRPDLAGGALLDLGIYPIAFARFLAGDPYRGGPFGILQPKLTAPPVEPDVILVPLIAVDRRGTRLGRGKGHYDRVLAPLRRKGARLIGVGWPLQRLKTEIPRDPWDVPLDGFASPDGLIFFARSGPV